MNGWVRWVTGRPRMILAAIAMMTVWAVWISVTEFRMNADLGSLIEQDAPWRQDFDAFQNEFPDAVHTAVVLVRSDSRGALTAVTRNLLEALQAKPAVFQAIAAPGSEPFFENHWLLYLQPQALDAFVDRVASAQPWLATVARDPSLRGLFELVSAGADSSQVRPLLEILEQTGRQALQGEAVAVDWSNALFPWETIQYRVIYLKPAAGISDRAFVNALRRTVAAVSLPEGVTVQLTGEIVLQEEELDAALTGVSWAGWLALGLLLVVMIVGVRSLKIVVATFTMLAIGVFWTAAFALLTVGEFNTLSAVFVVLFFGLGVDFALHFSLRYQEAINSGTPNVQQALGVSTQSVGRAISLCSLTTALGFLGFVPTAYAGLADLGLICAGGMIIAWVLSFTYLPAFYVLLGAPRTHTLDMPTSEKLVGWLAKRKRQVVGLLLACGLGAGYVASHLHFDYSVLALKDPQSPSMLALREMQAQGLATDYQLVALGLTSGEKERLLALPQVAAIRDLQSYVPENQFETLGVIEELGWLLESAVEPLSVLPAPSDEARRQSAMTLRALLLGSSSSEAKAFAGVLEAFLDQGDDAAWQRWQTALLPGLRQQIDWLKISLQTGAIAAQDLPASIRRRFVAATGTPLTAIVPTQDLTSVAMLSDFIQAVHSIIPRATGRPVIEWGVGRIVIEAFMQALVFALIAIVAVLWIVLRQAAAVLLVMLPLLFTALFTLAVTVAAGTTINMANILVIPLIFGLGVDNGIHVVDRYLGEGDVDHLVHSSTPRAVLLSSLTTLGAFSALILSPHQGTASIGFLLTVAVALILSFTVLLVPALLGGLRAR